MAEQHDRWGAVILAGGRSERMGRPKAFLQVDGEAALVRVARIVAAACDVVVVVGCPGEALPDLPADVIRVDDPADRIHEGPLSGIAVGLHALHERGVALSYVGACDAVFVTRAHVMDMLVRLADAGADAIVSADDQGIHPLAGAVRVPVAWARAEALVRAGERSARALYHALGTLRIAVADLVDPRVIRSCNTADEWSAALAELTAR